MIKQTKKICKGTTSHTKNYGCGKGVYKRHFGLCNTCLIDWCFNDPEGKKYYEKMKLKGKKKIEAIDKKEIKEQKELIIKKSELEKKLQSTINQIVRLIDQDNGCISCRHGWETSATRQMHAGHFYSVGAHPELRFNLFNIHKQCSVCNNYLSGNETNYTKGLLLHYGNDYMWKVAELKGKYNSLHLDKGRLNELIKIASGIKNDIIRGVDYSRAQINKELNIYE